MILFKVVPEGYYRYFFGVKVMTVILIVAQVIQMIAFTQIMDIWTPAITL